MQASISAFPSLSCLGCSVQAVQWKTLLSAFLFSPSIWIWGYFDRVLKQELSEYGFDFFSIRGNAFDRISDSIVLVVISMALPSELDGGEDP